MNKNIILHLGLGSFHRAHQAVYLQKLNDRDKGKENEWQLVSGNIRPENAEQIKLLKEAKGCYVVHTINPKGESRLNEITSIKEVIEYEAGLSPLIAVGSQVETKIISFTVTEAGYYLDDKTTLLKDAPDIEHDLALANDRDEHRSGKTSNKTIYGLIRAILKQRKAELTDKGDNGKVTLLNCDNLRDNGKKFRTGFIQFLEASNSGHLLDWFEANCSCPNAMVDRITPRPTKEIVQQIEAALNRSEPNGILAEEFIEWVIEEDFVNGRPQWEKVGVKMVQDVHSYEEAKIRILNATHSLIAWAGALVGYDYIHEGILDPRIKKLCFDYITNDVIPLLSPSPIDLENYRDVVLSRFSNRAILDTNQRVAMDGFSKIPGFVVPTIAERLKLKQSIEDVIVIPSLFLLFLLQRSRNKIKFDYEDQAMEEGFVNQVCIAEDSVAEFCKNKQLWGSLSYEQRDQQREEQSQGDIIPSMRRALSRIKEIFTEIKVD